MLALRRETNLGLASYESRARARLMALQAYVDLRDAGVEHAAAAEKACSLHGHDFTGPRCDRCGTPRGFR